MFKFCIIYTVVVDIMVNFSNDFCILNFLRDDFHIIIVTSYFWCSGVNRVKMTYFGHFNSLLLFWNVKLICPGIKKKNEIYVAGGRGAANSFFWTQPQAYKLTICRCSSNEAAVFPVTLDLRWHSDTVTGTWTRRQDVTPLIVWSDTAAPDFMGYRKGEAEVFLIWYWKICCNRFANMLQHIEHTVIIDSAIYLNSLANLLFTNLL